MKEISFLSKLFKKREHSSESPLILEYLIVFQKSGLPIFSKCFGDFCSVLMVDDTLLSGFLSAMTSMPSFFSQQANLDSIELGFTKLFFSYTLPSGHVICLGFNKNSTDPQKEKKIDELFEKITQFVENDKKEVDWSFLSTEEISPIIDELLTKIIEPWVHLSAENHSEHSNNCPICIDGPLFRGENDIGVKEPIWKRLKDLYTMGRKMFADQIPAKRKKLREKGLLDD